MQAPPSLHRTNNPLRASGLFFCRPLVLKKRERGFGVVGQQTASFPGQEANFRFLDLKFSVFQRVGTSFRGRKQRLFL